MIVSFQSKLTKYEYYIFSMFIVIISNVLWYNFRNPPVGGNVNFDVFPLTSYFNIKYILSPINPMSWPGSFNAPSISFANQIFYSLLYYAAGSSYSVSFFLENLIPEVLGGFSLVYLFRKYTDHTSIPSSYSLLGVTFYAFNTEIVLGANVNFYFETGTSFLLIFLFLLYKATREDSKFILLMGFASFYLLQYFPGGYPNGAYFLSVEFVAATALSLLERMYHYMLKNHNAHLFWTSIRRHSLIICVILLSNLYLLFAVINVASSYVDQTLTLTPIYSFDFQNDSIQQIWNSLRLINNWAAESIYAPLYVTHYLNNIVIQILLFIVPLLSLFSVAFAKRKIDIILFIVLAISILFSASINTPFKYVFEYLVVHVFFLRPFYNGASVYPLLVIFYSILMPVTVFHIVKFLQKYKSKRSHSQMNSRLVKYVVPGIIVAIMLVSTYPMLSYEYDNGTPMTPVSSHLPSSYLNSSNYIRNYNENGPVMVFPAMCHFERNIENGTVWYAGTDMYPQILQNPIVSGMLPVSYVNGRGNAPSEIQKIYQLNFTAFDQQTIQSPNYILNKYVKWNQSKDSYNSDIGLYLNITEKNNSFFGFLRSNLDLAPYDYLVVNFTSFKGFNQSDFFVAIFNGTNGYGYNFAKPFLILKNRHNYSEIFVLNSPLTRGIVNLTTINKLAFYYLNYPNESNNSNTGFPVISVSDVQLLPPQKQTTALASDMRMMGIEFAYVDTSVWGNSTYVSYLNNTRNGDYYVSMFSNSTAFSLIYDQGSIFIYKNNFYNGLFSAYTRYYSYTPENLNYLLSSGLTFLTLNTTHNFNVSGNRKVQLSCTENSATDFIVIANHTTPFFLYFPETYSQKWIATSSNGSVLEHFMANDYSNAWYVPLNTSEIQIYLAGTEKYTFIETGLIIIPFMELSTFLIMRVPSFNTRFSRRRRKK